MSSAAPIRLPRLMLVTDRRRTHGRELDELVAHATRGGVGIVQVREPDLPDDELRALVRRLRVAAAAETTFVVNASVRVARTTGCGLHLPARAAPLGARRDGPRPYGRSVHDDAELARALDDGVDYLIVGTVFDTESKPGRPGAGTQALGRLVQRAGTIPVYAIGGITVAGIPQVVHAGAHGVAVAGGLLGARDPERVAQAMVLALEVARRNPR